MPWERTRPREVSVYRDACFLADCEPNEARDWLSKRPMNFSSVTGGIETPKDCHVLEYILYRRQDSFINLALAEYGRSRTVLSRIYRHGDGAIRVVACSNPSLFDGDYFGDLFSSDDIFQRKYEGRSDIYLNVVKHAPLAELRALCENPYLTHNYLSGLVNWTGLKNNYLEEGEEISESRSLHLIRFLAKNPQISMSREESRESDYWDGFSDFEYRSTFSDMWKLAVTAPTTYEWAEVLTNFFAGLQGPVALDNVDEVLDLWRIDFDKKYEVYVVRIFWTRSGLN